MRSTGSKTQTTCTWKPACSQSPQRLRAVLCVLVSAPANIPLYVLEIGIKLDPLYNMIYTIYVYWIGNCIKMNATTRAKLNNLLMSGWRCVCLCPLHLWIRSVKYTRSGIMGEQHSLTGDWVTPMNFICGGRMERSNQLLYNLIWGSEWECHG